MHMAAGRFHSLFVRFQIKVEMSERVVLDVARGIAQRVELGQPVGGLAATRGEIHLDEFQRLLQIRIGERIRSILLEARRSGVAGHATAFARRRGSPLAGPSVMSASTSATWRARTGWPTRCSLPAMFMRQ